MQTKLSRICDAIIEAGWLTALVVAPLFFNTFSNRVFEPDKIHLVRSIALLIAVAWLTQLVDGRLHREPGEPRLWARIRHTPLVLPALILVVSYLLSTALSLVPRISFLGSYVRLQGTLTFLAYILIFGAVLTHLRTRQQISHLLHAVIITSLPIAIYGIIQNAGLDPLPWGGNVVERVAANMGNAIFVAAYLIMAVFLTLERLLHSMAALLKSQNSGIGEALRAGAYLFVLVVQLVAIVFTQSRGPQLGLAAGLYVFAMLGLLLLARWGAQEARGPAFLRWLGAHVRTAWMLLIGLTIAALAFIVVLNIPSGPLSAFCRVRYVSRTCTLFSLDEGTNAVRALIWEGVVDLMSPHAPLQGPDGQTDSFNAIRPLVGYGPESLWVAFNRFYPPELGRFESRNASPDRSHNETFDALARGGLVQLAAEVLLFSSVFYFALRWLGLIHDRRSRNLFIAFLAGGGALGVILPLVFDGSLRLAGIGWPAGLIVGLVSYVTVNLIGARRTLESDPAVVGDRSRQLLVLAVFSAIVAHFVELHFGIAIVSTMTHFWVLAGVLVVVGMGWVREEEAEFVTVVAQKPGEVALGRAASQPARTSAQEAQRSQAGKRKGSDSKQRHPVERRSSAAPVRSSAAPVVRKPWLALLPYVLIMALITAILVWDYTIERGGGSNPFSVLWNAFTTRTRDFQTVGSPMMLVLVLFTWLVGGITAIAEARENGNTSLSVWRGALFYFGVALAVFLVYGLIHAARIDIGTRQGLEVFRHIAGHIVLFDIVLLLLLATLAIGLALARPRPWPPRFARQGLASGSVAFGLSVLAVLAIAFVNIRTVQADTYYKQGLGYESSGQWEGSVVLYRQAARLQPQEDYYYLFLGRALLQLSELAQSGTAVLPENLDSVPTDQLLGMVDRATQAGTREDIMRAAHAVLVGAQRLNPLNTDHTANLARLHRAWAFTGAVGPGESGDANRLREAFETQPDKVNQVRLLRSIDYYREAVALSPNNAGLWNELVNVQYIQGDLAGARATLERSLAVDDEYYPTYMLLGDVLTAAGDTQGALVAYQRAAEIAPKNVNVLSAVGVTAVAAGDPQASIGAFQGIIESTIQALNATQAQLNQLNDEATAAGGYENLQGSATSRRATLEQQIAGHEQQLSLTYRNLALVLRDSGRIADALDAAQRALVHAPESERVDLESLVASLQGETSP